MKIKLSIIACVILTILSLFTACSAHTTTIENISPNVAASVVDDVPEEDECTDETVEEKMIFVYACGAVLEPGVKCVPEGSRAEYVLELAGGFDEGANTIYVNLAAEVSDGQRLYFPYIDEDMNQELGIQDAGGEGMSQSGDSYPVNINTADVNRLCSVPGIGETRANAIIEYRNNYGLFEKAEDIMKVSGIGEATYAKLEAYICVQ